MKLRKIDPQVVDRFIPQRDDTTFVSLPGQGQVRRRSQGQVCEGEGGDLADTSGTVIEKDQQHAVAVGLRGGTIERSKDRRGLVCLEVFDRLSRRRRRFQRLRSVVERDQGEIFLGRESQKRGDRSQP